MNVKVFQVDPLIIAINIIQEQVDNTDMVAGRSWAQFAAIPLGTKQHGVA